MTNDRVFMTGYRVQLDEVEPNYAITFPSQGVVAATNKAGDIDNDSDAIRGAGNVVNLVEEMDGEAYAHRGKNYNGVEHRMDGYSIVAAELRLGADGHTSTANTAMDATLNSAPVANATVAADSSLAGQYRTQDISGTAVFYNGKAYDVPRPAPAAVKSGDVGLVELLKSKITGRVWDDSYNYDGLQATKTEGEGASAKRVLDEAAEPGIPNEEMRLTQWIYVKPAKWVAFAENHSDLVDAMQADAKLWAEISGSFEYDGDDNLITEKEIDGETVTSAYGFITKGVWVRNIRFGEDRYTALTTGTAPALLHKPYMTGSRYLGNGVVAVDTSAGALNATTNVLEGAGIYTFDKLPTVSVVQNADYDEFYLAAYRVEIPAMENTAALNNSGHMTDGENDTWLLTRSRTYGNDPANLPSTVTPAADIMFDSDVTSLADSNIGVAGGYIVAQQQGIAADAGKETLTRQLNGQIDPVPEAGPGRAGQLQYHRGRGQYQQHGRRHRQVRLDEGSSRGPGERLCRRRCGRGAASLHLHLRHRVAGFQ